MTRARAREPRRCEQCGQMYLCRVDLRRQRFCSYACKYAWARSRPKTWKGTTIRRLRDDEPIPASQPKRYRTGTGYIVLRWKVGVGDYVEAFEHRIVTGRVSDEVHHINGIKDDNRPENLRPVTSIEHGTEHAGWNIAEAVRLYGSGWSLVRLSKHYVRHSSVILRALKLRGVKMRSPQEAWRLRKQASWCRPSADRSPVSMRARK